MTSELINYGLDFEDHVLIREDSPFTVPTGKYFMATAFGCKDWAPARESQATRMLVDDVIKYETTLQWEDEQPSPGNLRTAPIVDLARVPGGLVAQAGEVVKAEITAFVGSPSTARILGVCLPLDRPAPTEVGRYAVPGQAWRRIGEGETFNVPADHFFCLTGFGFTEAEADIERYDVTVSIDGAAELFSAIHWRDLSTAPNQPEARSGDRIVHVPPGFVAQGALLDAGSSLTGQVGTGGGATKSYAPRVSPGGGGGGQVTGQSVTVSANGTTKGFAVGYIKRIR